MTGTGLPPLPPAIPLVPCLLPVCLSSTEIITESWERAKSSKTNADTQNVVSFFC